MTEAVRRAGFELSGQTKVTESRPQRTTSAAFRPKGRTAAPIRCVPAVFLAAAIFFSAVSSLRAQHKSADEYQLEAVSLFNFTEFIDWPQSSFAGPESPFLVCIVGTDPFGRVLDDSLLGKTVGERPVQIGRFPGLKTANQSRACQIVFLSASLQRHSRELIERFRGASVLLVGDMPDFAASGGAVELTVEEGHVRFTINPDAAGRAGLRVSSKLLSLAKIVHDAPRNGQS